jgi:chromosome segregation ATPase
MSITLREAADIEMAALPPNPSPAPEQKSCCGKCCGFIWKDWTQVVGRLGVFGGLVTGGVGLVLSNPYVVAGGVAAVVIAYCFPDIRLSCVKPEREFEDNVAYFNAENARLNAQIEKLGTELEELKKSKVALDSILHEAQAEVLKLKGDLQMGVDDLQAITLKLQNTEKQLQILQELYNKFKDEATKVAKDLNQFNKVNKVFKEKVTELSSALDDLDSSADRISIEVGEVKNLNAFYDTQNKHLTTLMAILGQNVGSLEQRFSQMKAALVELAQQTQTLDIADDKILEGSKRLETQTILLEKLLSGFNDMIGNIDVKEEELGGQELIELLRKEQEEKDKRSAVMKEKEHLRTEISSPPFRQNKLHHAEEKDSTTVDRKSKSHHKKEKKKDSDSPENSQRLKVVLTMIGSESDDGEDLELGIPAKKGVESKDSKK